MRIVNQAERTRRRHDILNTAGTLFAGHGFGATSMDQIARACRLKKASLYYYFQGKKQILRHLIHLRLAEDHTLRMEPLRGRGLERALFDLGTSYLATLQQRPNREFFELLVRDSFNDRYVRQVFADAIQGRVAECTAAMSAAGLTGPQRKYLILGMQQFMNALRQYFLETRILGTTSANAFRDRDYIRGISKIFACGLGKLTHFLVSRPAVERAA